MKLFDVYPINQIAIERAEGSYVWDTEDNKYLDMYGGHAVISIGHTHPHYVARLQEQLKKIAFYSNSIEIPIQKELADKLGKISGKEDYQLFLCNSGAEANENALKLASFYNGRKKIVSFTKAFHGRTSLAVAVTDNKNIVAPVNETERRVSPARKEFPPRTGGVSVDKTPHSRDSQVMESTQCLPKGVEHFWGPPVNQFQLDRTIHDHDDQ